MERTFAHDPTEFLVEIKTAGGCWCAMNAARLVMGRGVADAIRDNMGEHWLNVVIAERLVAARDAGVWSFAHSTLKSWLDHQADRLDIDEYRQRLIEHAEDGKADFMKLQ